MTSARPDASTERLSIRPLSETELPALQGALPKSEPDRHRRRFAAQQNGGATYLLAWLDDLPVAHLLVRWRGPENPDLPAIAADRPCLEDLLVREDLRSCGIGTRLIAEAERLAGERGHGGVGLAVGVANARARALYDRLGYRDSGAPPFDLTWTYIDAAGRPRVEGEPCHYLTHALAPVGGALDNARGGLLP